MDICYYHFIWFSGLLPCLIFLFFVDFLNFDLERRVFPSTFLVRRSRSANSFSFCLGRSLILFHIWETVLQDIIFLLGSSSVWVIWIYHSILSLLERIFYWKSDRNTFSHYQLLPLATFNILSLEFLLALLCLDLRCYCMHLHNQARRSFQLHRLLQLIPSPGVGVFLYYFFEQAFSCPLFPFCSEAVFLNSVMYFSKHLSFFHISFFFLYLNLDP